MKLVRQKEQRILPKKMKFVRQKEQRISTASVLGQQPKVFFPFQIWSWVGRKNNEI